MLDTFDYVVSMFWDLVNDFTMAIDNYLGIGTKTINLYLFSDNLIVDFTVIELLNYILLGLLFYYFFKFIINLIRFPIKSLQRFMNRM